MQHFKLLTCFEQLNDLISLMKVIMTVRDFSQQRGMLERWNHFLMVMICLGIPTSLLTPPRCGLGPDTLAPETLGPDTLGPDTLKPNRLAPNRLGPKGLGPDTLGPNTLGPNGL